MTLDEALQKILEQEEVIKNYEQEKTAQQTQIEKTKTQIEEFQEQIKKLQETNLEFFLKLSQKEEPKHEEEKQETKVTWDEILNKMEE